jgi:tripartite-type tricarboxylate transporter receptor subunit TctC
MKKLLFAALCAIALQGAARAADDYPSRPIVMIAPLGVGGSTDVIARIVAQGLSKDLGQNIAVENVTGAGGSIGEGRLARSRPDGYTIGIGQWGTNVANGAIYKLNYDLMNDFEPIGLIATQPFLIVSRKSIPAANLKELIAWLRANGSKTNEGHSGVGTPAHVAGLLFQKEIGVTWTMVPYRGAGESLQAVVAGQDDIILSTPDITIGQMKAGNVRAYAVTAPTRTPVAADIPTTDEAGLPGFYFTFWHALWAPKGTPKEILAKLSAALQKTLADPDMRKRLTDIGQEIFPADQQTPAALRKFQQSEIDKWWPIIKAANIKVD